MHDDRILLAMREYGEQGALKALRKLIDTPSHKRHERAVTVLDRMYPVENVLNVKHNHDVTPNFQNTAKTMARMVELAAKFGAPMPSLPAPIVIDNDEVQPCK
jgi:hypothetical protein